MTDKPMKWSIVQLQVERDLRGNKCQWEDLYPDESCNITSSLQFAHIRKTKLNGPSRGSYERLHDIRTHQKSYKLLCSTHHRKRDNGEDKNCFWMKNE